MRACVTCFVVGVAVGAATASADEPAPVRPGLAAQWQLERATLADGRSLEGLVLDEPDATDDDLGFIEIVRHPGRPMHLITRRLPARMVHSIERLPAGDHAALASRVEAFRVGGRAEREAAAAVRLARRGEDGPWWYEGQWFTLESSAGQPLTRQAIVRLESLLDAFAGLLPPSREEPVSRRLTVRLCGSAAEYAGVQAEQGVKVANPAFYLPRPGLLVAGSDVPAVLEQAQIAADGLDATAARQRALDAEVTAGLRDLAAELESQGIPASQRAEIVARTRVRWQREKATTLARVDQARKENDARVARARGEFFTALAHEAWHAYADLRLARHGPLPAWLDEGLAQVFEAGLLEAGELRLDAPDPQRLARLAELLTNEPHASLAPLLSGGERQFVVGHGNAAAASREAYLLAWGVAYDLSLGAPVLSAQAIEDAAGGGPSAGDDVARLERLVGMPLAEFTAAWRARMLGLARRPSAATPRRGEQADVPPAPASAAAPRADRGQ